MITSISPRTFNPYLQQKQTLAQKTAPRFGICVNAKTTAEEFQRLLIQDSWATSYHAIASAGGQTRADIVELMIKFLKGDLGNKINDSNTKNKMQRLTIMALAKSGLAAQDPAMRQRIIDALKEAMSKRYMRDEELQRLLKEAIEHVEKGSDSEHSAMWEEVANESEKATHH